MSNTVLRFFSGSALVAGIALVVSTTGSIMTAQVSSPGSTLFSRSAVVAEARLEPVSLHASADVLDLHPDLRAQLLIGMLLILLGFAFYSMWIVRMRPVHARRKSAR